MARANNIDENGLIAGRVRASVDRIVAGVDRVGQGASAQRQAKDRDRGSHQESMNANNQARQIHVATLLHMATDNHPAALKAAK